MPHDCHSREGGNPEKHWMPDQVRHDEQGTLCALAYERVSVLLLLSFPLVGNLSKISAEMKKTHPCTPLKRGLRRIPDKSE